VHQWADDRVIANKWKPTVLIVARVVNSLEEALVFWNLDPFARARGHVAAIIDEESVHKVVGLKTFGRVVQLPAEVLRVL
jgi:hypothetical protein